jgi:predicted RNase H-like HicB family nuclease
MMMAISADFQIYFTQRSDGTFLAASNEAPFFCFEGATESEVSQTVIRALEIYEKGVNRNDFRRPRSETVPVTTFVPSRIRSKKDLVTA